MVRFEVWAPKASSLEVVVDGRRKPMRDANRPGWWQADVPTAVHGSDYAFAIDGNDPLPDPRSRWQPTGPDGPSRVVDHAAYAWGDGAWTGRPLPGAVVYELHIGTFTTEGTFAAAVERLDHLVDLGVTHVEVMPVSAFPGRHGWGYDGVCPWAVHEPYGGPDGLKRFVDACHTHGLGVILDVVHNHLGPSGNHLPAFGPYFTDRYRTPWGSAVNLDGPGSDEVRAYLVGSALMWLRDYHVDGLRLDAVHALADNRAVPFLEELSEAVDKLAAATGRPLFLIAESDLNDPRVVTPRESGGMGVQAQWSDDFHHALHALLTGERQGYYGDFGSMGTLAKTLTRVWLHDGTWSSFRERTHGRPVPVSRMPAYRFLGYLQTHDQVGNRATGDRISATLPPALLAAGAALVLTAPFTPMLFMGEEWGASTPWQYFTDHTDPELAEAVRNGRRAEFASHGWDAAQIPDPQSAQTVRDSCLDWKEPARAPHAALLAWYRRLIALRREWDNLTDPDLTRVQVSFEETAGWLMVHRGAFRTAVNLAEQPATLPMGTGAAEIVAAWDDRAEIRRGLVGTTLRLPATSVAVVRIGTR
ncbi:malto-oligosyltrehalose trehalohydrolase [Embleya scabrispora]|uniref:Malto-oligosyltrehalose trehalohydrolase n=1 Tax=Embleya scabrispora TaxID=159449 RepID=A0A1T3NUY2_9ACTN|nr:malto-oligosyltrehalose trehalohydrolase [Embleya scabrispora]OPC80608.1 malto-oligosyltrehalose trehalohydrolase [Embleya scabrispora]